MSAVIDLYSMRHSSARDEDSRQHRATGSGSSIARLMHRLWFQPSTSSLRLMSTTRRWQYCYRSRRDSRLPSLPATMQHSEWEQQSASSTRPTRSRFGPQPQNPATFRPNASIRACVNARTHTCTHAHMHALTHAHIGRHEPADQLHPDGGQWRG